MDDKRRKFKRESPEQRKLALVEATLQLVADHGVRGATVRRIAEQADVTQGLIRHYFSTKEDLIVAAYEHHMVLMTDLTSAPADAIEGSARERLIAFVVASLTPPVVDPRSLALWASFLNKVQNDPQMKAMHQRTYAYFRDRLEDLIRDAYGEAERQASDAKFRHLAIACNAVIDGLWLEGGALPDAFAAGELKNIGLDSVGSILGLNLIEEAKQQ